MSKVTRINGKVVEEMPTLTIKETLFICKYARKCGMECVCKPSHELQHFNSVKVWLKGKFNNDHIRFIQSNFAKQYNCDLHFENATDKNGVISVGYFYKVKFKKENE